MIKRRKLPPLSLLKKIILSIKAKSKLKINFNQQVIDRDDNGLFLRNDDNTSSIL
jgi:hypothetical protein